MLSTRTTHWLRPLVFALAVAVLAVPTAQANLTPAGKYGALDPWASNVIHQSAQSVPLITEHSAGQNGVSMGAAASVPAAAANGFHWGAAGIGASVAFASILLALGVAAFIVRRSRTRLAGL